MKTINLTKESFGTITKTMLKRSTSSYPKQEAAVRDIVDKVRDKGDEAVFDYASRFDGVDLNARNIRVTIKEEKEAYKSVSPELLSVIRKSLENIRSFHEKQLKESWFTTNENGSFLGQKVTPLNRVGVYVPGGKAAYPSTVLMNIVPAKVAGVNEIIMCTPCGKDGTVNPSTWHFLFFLLP